MLILNVLQMMKVIQAASEVSNKMSEYNLGEGRRPGSLAGAAIFLVCKLHPTDQKSLKEIAEVLNSSENAIRQVYC